MANSAWATTEYVLVQSNKQPLKQFRYTNSKLYLFIIYLNTSPNTQSQLQGDCIIIQYNRKDN